MWEVMKCTIHIRRFAAISAPEAQTTCASDALRGCPGVEEFLDRARTLN